MQSLAQLEACAVLVLPEVPPPARPHDMRQGRGQSVMQGSGRSEEAETTCAWN